MAGCLKPRAYKRSEHSLECDDVTMPPTLNENGTLPNPTQLTFPPGASLLANWGELGVTGL